MVTPHSATFSGCSLAHAILASSLALTLATCAFVRVTVAFHTVGPLPRLRGTLVYFEGKLLLNEYVGSLFTMYVSKYVSGFGIDKCKDRTILDHGKSNAVSETSCVSCTGPLKLSHDHDSRKCLYCIPVLDVFITSRGRAGNFPGHPGRCYSY